MSDEMCPNPVTCPFVDITEPHPVSDHPGMSDRRPEMEPQLFIGIDGGDCYNHVEAEFSDLLFAVRRGVESGTIKGEVVDYCVEHNCGIHPGDPNREQCPIWSWESEYRPEPVPCDVVSRLVIPVDVGEDR